MKFHTVLFVQNVILTYPIHAKQPAKTVHQLTSYSTIKHLKGTFVGSARSMDAKDACPPQII